MENLNVNAAPLQLSKMCLSSALEQLDYYFTLNITHPLKTSSAATQSSKPSIPTHPLETPLCNK